MGYKSLRDCVKDLERNHMLVRVVEPVDPNLEIADIQFKVNEAGGPALLFENIKGSPFQAVSNIYGTNARIEYIFRHTLDKVKKVVSMKKDPTLALRNPLEGLKAGLAAWRGLPRRSRWNRASRYGITRIDQLPLIKSWPMDGGAFITLPQVCTLPPDERNIMKSNLGMYRIQMNGNDYIFNEEVGMHYQIHRGIGVHHQAYNNSAMPFKASIFVGGPPSNALSAIMPLPEGLSELTFAGMLNGRRFRYDWEEDCVIACEADFVITGTILKDTKKPEGPFGDHLGYYSLEHPFPVMKVDKVYHRRNPLWHFTAVGRPPQEDSGFGYLIHQIVAPLTPEEFPGLVELHAVDAAGVHPLLLAIGKERYMPFREKQPEEILTIANHILGSGQTSLAKYVIIAAQDEYAGLNTHNIPSFLQHVLERVDWRRDLHFQTKTTIDTLDYSGDGWNSGSKVVIAARGDRIRSLATQLPPQFILTDAFKAPKLVLPGIVAMEYNGLNEHFIEQIGKLATFLKNQALKSVPLLIVVDDSQFVAETLNNFLWVTFTRSNPASDIYGVDSWTIQKHWGCNGSLIIDARKKPHHAPELERLYNVDRFFKKGGSLHGIL